MMSSTLLLGWNQKPLHNHGCRFFVLGVHWNAHSIVRGKLPPGACCEHASQ